MNDHPSLRDSILMTMLLGAIIALGLVLVMVYGLALVVLAPVAVTTRGRIWLRRQFDFAAGSPPEDIEPGVS